MPTFLVNQEDLRILRCNWLEYLIAMDLAFAFLLHFFQDLLYCLLKVLSCFESFRWFDLIHNFLVLFYFGHAFLAHCFQLLEKLLSLLLLCLDLVLFFKLFSFLVNFKGVSELLMG